jgi:DNA-binding CsgD family transcriptional regulator
LIFFFIFLSDIILLNTNIARRKFKVISYIFAKTQDTQYIPPVLTPRELQVLEYIVDGEQHGQIAETLGISAETVKVHVRNILRKFGAQRISECMPEAIEYVKAFGSKHDDLDTYMVDCDIITSVVDNFESCRRTVEAQFVCMKENLTSFEWQIRNSGTLRTVTINGAAPTDITQYENTYVFKTNFANSLKLGECFKVYIDYTFDHYPMDEGSHKVITHPTRRISITVKFDKSSIPADIWAAKGIPHLQTETVTTGFQANPNEASLVIDNPRREEVVGIIWKR